MGSSPGQIVNLRQKKTYMFNELCNLAIMLSVCYIVLPSIVLFICGPKVYNRLPLSELLAVLDTYTYSETSFGPVQMCASIGSSSQCCHHAGSCVITHHTIV